ncbi:hypothetical protein BGZ73_005451 [Actinomortierella ambigua]|nr:hypothetical protein BGZ73_005451 [Actinomortierella ambigua]
MTRGKSSLSHDQDQSKDKHRHKDKDQKHSDEESSEDSDRDTEEYTSEETDENSDDDSDTSSESEEEQDAHDDVIHDFKGLTIGVPRPGRDMESSAATSRSSSRDTAFLPEVRERVHNLCHGVSRSNNGRLCNRFMTHPVVDSRGVTKYYCFQHDPENYHLQCSAYVNYSRRRRCARICSPRDVRKDQPPLCSQHMPKLPKTLLRRR